MWNLVADILVVAGLLFWLLAMILLTWAAVLIGCHWDDQHRRRERRREKE